MNKQITWKALNAYVDGELSATNAAEVAKAVAQDAELAQRVAHLTSLKATLGKLQPCDNHGIDLDDIVDKRSRGLQRVASVAGIFLLGALLAGLVLMGKTPLTLDQMAYAEAIHHEWLKSEKQISDSVQNGKLKVALQTMNFNAYIPDLSKVNLSYDAVKTILMGKDVGLHIGYKGPSGCMVSLIAFRNPLDLGDDLAAYRQDQRTVYGWKTGKEGFYLLANHMDPGRLLEIAHVLYNLMQTRSVLNEQSMAALDQAKASSQPCA